MVYKYIGPILYLKSKQKYEWRGNSTNFRKAFNLVLIKLFCRNENLFVQNWRKERKHIITKKVTAGIKDGRWLNILLEFTVFSVFSEKSWFKIWWLLSHALGKTYNCYNLFIPLFWKDLKMLFTVLTLFASCTVNNLQILLPSNKYKWFNTVCAVYQYLQSYCSWVDRK